MTLVTRAATANQPGFILMTSPNARLSSGRRKIETAARLSLPCAGRLLQPDVSRPSNGGQQD